MPWMKYSWLWFICNLLRFGFVQESSSLLAAQVPPRSILERPHDIVLYAAAPMMGILVAGCTSVTILCTTLKKTQLGYWKKKISPTLMQT
jgi:hypothetical protein